MSVTSPPRAPEIEQDRDLEQRVADLEALIEEARRRALRRRMRIGAAVVLVAAAGGGVDRLRRARRRRCRRGGARPQPRRAGSGRECRLLAAWGATGRRSFEAFAFDPRDPNIVYVGTGVTNSSKSRVYKSTDAGAHWQLVSGPGWIWLGALASDPKHPATLYASTSTGIYKTTDAGRTWQAFSRGLLPAGGEGWGRLAADPNNSNIIYAGLGGGVHKSIDAGHNWQTVLRLRRDGWLALVAATRPTTIYATSFSKWHRIGRRENRLAWPRQLDRRRQDVAANALAPRFEDQRHLRRCRRPEVADHALCSRTGPHLHEHGRRPKLALHRTRPTAERRCDQPGGVRRNVLRNPRQGRRYQTTDAGQTSTHGWRSPVQRRASAWRPRDRPGSTRHRLRVRPLPELCDRRSHPPQHRQRPHLATAP